MITLQHARKLRELIVKASTSLDDESALQGIELFPLWQGVTPMKYEVGDRVRYNDVLYTCAQPHTSQAQWTPDITPALWTEVSIDEWPEWKQPLGAQDAYRLGDKVSHLEKHWISTLDYNTYEPSVYGWDEVN